MKFPHEKYMLHYINQRTLFFDKSIDTAVEYFQSLDSNVKIQVVFLGIGFDTRPYRLKSLNSKNIQIFEIDFESTIAFRDEIIKTKCKDILDSFKVLNKVSSLNCDIREKNGARLIESLKNNGFDEKCANIWVAEGLLSYLSKDEVNILFDNIGNQLSNKDEHKDKDEEKDKSSVKYNQCLITNCLNDLQGWKDRLNNVWKSVNQDKEKQMKNDNNKDNEKKQDQQQEQEQQEKKDKAITKSGFAEPHLLLEKHGFNEWKIEPSTSNGKEIKYQDYLKLLKTAADESSKNQNTSADDSGSNLIFDLNNPAPTVLSFYLYGMK